MESLKGQSVYVWGLFNGKQFTTPEKVKELEGKGIIRVASGGLFYLALSDHGNVFGWGSAKHSRYGIPGDDSFIPRLIPLKVQVKAIAAGNWHSMLIDSNGRVHSTGHNKQGACGVGTFTNLDSFTPVKIQPLAQAISCGDCVSLIITQNSQLYSCGHTELHGHKSKEHLNLPKRLAISQEKVVAVSAGFSHALAVTQHGRIYSWGSGNFYQLGHASKHDQKEPRAISKLSQVRIVQVSCTRGEKNAHSMALAEDGSVYTWGAGYKGKLGHEKSWSHQDQADEPQPRLLKTVQCKVRKVCAGGIHSNLLSQDGEIMSFGCGSDGRLGHSKSNEYVYLYRQGIPKVIDGLKHVKVSDLDSSYYHNICLGAKRE